MRKDKDYGTGRETLLRALLDRLHRRGYEDIRASWLEEFEGNRPPMIFWEGTDRGERPDAFARKDGSDTLFQIETAETISGEAASRRAALFCAWALHYRRHFCLVAPAAAREEGRALLKRAGADERFVHLVAV